MKVSHAGHDDQYYRPQVYIVVSGDSLWKISQKLYGTGQRWYTIYDMNIDLKGVSPANIDTGMALTALAE